MDNKIMDEQKALKELKKRYSDAEELINNPDKMERFLQRLEDKLKRIPKVGNKLADIPVMVSLVRKYIKKEYTDLPIGTIVAIVAALIYFVSPIDIVPDGVPILGCVDDVAVISVCWKLVESDVNEYIKWREKNGMVCDF